VIVSKPKKLPSIAESLELALFYCNRDLRNGRLQSALVQISSDGKETVTLLNPLDWQQRTERNHAKYIGGHSDAVIRAAQIDLASTAEDPVVVPLASRRP
jgi:hypothetical protein